MTEPHRDRLSRAQRRAVQELLRIAPVVDELGARFKSAGHDIALVGGSVRDAMLGRLGTDLDFTTSARPEQTQGLLGDWADARWAVGQAFGTIGAQKAGFQIEITTYRSDVYERASRKPQVTYGRSIEEDLVRRDFTINAMAIALPDRQFIDPHNGLADLGRKIIRTPGTPEASFSDDPLRIMRAARFAAQLDFAVAPEVVDAMRDMADRIEIVSAERVRDELSKLLLSKHPRSGLTLLVDTGLADLVLPELPALKLEIDEHHRHKDVYEHSLTVLEQAIDLEHRLPALSEEKERSSSPPERATADGEPNLVLRLAALLHDIGKPKTRRHEPGGGVSFHHHDVVGAKLARKRLRTLHYPSAVIDSVSKLIELHLRFHGYGTGQWTDSAVRRYARDAGEDLPWLHILTRADCTTRNKRKALALQEAYDHLEERIDQLAEQEELDKLRPDLDGNAIMKLLGIPPGPLVGRAYNHMMNVRLDRGALSEDDARAELLQWWSEQPESE